MKKITVSIVAILSVLFCSMRLQGAEGDRFQVGNLWYEINYGDISTVSVTFPQNGDIIGYTDLVGDLAVPPTVQYQSKTYRVNRIADEAFRLCERLTSVALPNTIIEIGYDAFAFCKGLKTIKIPNSVVSIGGEAFWSCYELKEIVIPENVETIGRNAFLYTAWYENQPDGVIYINDAAYTYKGIMPENASIVLRDGTVGIWENAFRECASLHDIFIPATVTWIGDWAFRDCTGLESVHLPEGLAKIGEKAFEGCTKLATSDFPKSLGLVGKDAFDHTPWYDSLPNGLVYVGAVAYDYIGKMPEGTDICLKEGTKALSADIFTDCHGLKSIVLPRGLEAIGDNAFANCTGLAEISIPNTVKTIGISAFKWCTGLQKMTIPDSVEELADYAFSNCSNLTEVSIGKSVGTIGASTFANCKNLTAVIIPDAVRKIGFGAFDGCSGMQSVSMSDSVHEIGIWAFHGCSNLSEIRIDSAVPPVVYDTTFGEINSTVFENAKLYVPKGATAAFVKNKIWGKFKTIIETDF